MQEAMLGCRGKYSEGGTDPRCLHCSLGPTVCKVSRLHNAMFPYMHNTASAIVRFWTQVDIIRMHVWLRRLKLELFKAKKCCVFWLNLVEIGWKFDCAKKQSIELPIGTAWAYKENQEENVWNAVCWGKNTSGGSKKTWKRISGNTCRKSVLKLMIRLEMIRKHCFPVFL